MLGVLAAMTSPDVLLGAAIAGWIGRLLPAAFIFVAVAVFHETALGMTQTYRPVEATISGTVNVFVALVVVALLVFSVRKLVAS